jgi:soluble lytic murein transglycosylase
LSQARRDFHAALQALAAGRLDEAEGRFDRLHDYPLLPHLEARWLEARWGRAPASETSDWLARHAGDWPAEALRSRWLGRLARSGDHARLLADWRPQTDAALTCAWLRARAAAGDPDAGWYGEAAALWAVGSSRPPDCDPVFERLLASPFLDEALHWRRLTDAVGRGNLDFAGWLTRRFPAFNAPHAEELVAAARAPRPWLARRAGQPPATDPRAAEAERLAYAAWAKTDAEAAARHLAARLPAGPVPAAETPQVLVVTQALLARDDDRAGDWLDRLDPEHLPAAIQATLPGWAMAREDWPRLARATGAAPAEGMEPLRWRYFRARALEATGRAEEARALYRELARGTDYYAQRAAERLGEPYRFEATSRAVTRTETLERMERTPAVARAREWLAIGRANEARREWREFTRALDPEGLATAARIAHAWGWHDRALLTAARVPGFDDPDLRFPLPWRAEIEDAAALEGLAVWLVYSVVRNESAFQVDAGSGVGALGLMQLMPATGRETAGRLGLALTADTDLLEPRLNLRLGSHYLARMLGRYEGNLAMAAAAYNAGPGRVAAWRPAQGCRDAEAWIERIPFRETHAYVRKVLAYHQVYAWRLGAPAPTLAALAPPVPAQATPSLACSALAGR